MKICPVEAELFPAEGWTDGRTDGQTDMKNLTVAFRNSANASKILIFSAVDKSQILTNTPPPTHTHTHTHTQLIVTQNETVPVQSRCY
jgi:hypothetical protein